MSTEVAMTAIISGKAVELAGIITLGWLIHAAIPQLRMSPPRTDNGSSDKHGGKP